jgi:HTH-type transcriptional regulator/antitoxin HipB
MKYVIRDAADLGSMIRDARTQEGLTQSQLAQQLGVGRQYINELERGKENLVLARLFAALDRLHLELDGTDRPAETGVDE